MDQSQRSRYPHRRRLSQRLRERSHQEYMDMINQEREIELLDEIKQLKAENELLGSFGGMRIGEGESQHSGREEITSMRAQLAEVAEERNRFEAMVDQLRARCGNLEHTLQHTAQQVVLRKRRIAELENTVGEMDRAGSALQNQVQQQQVIIESMQREKSDLVNKGNACLDKISVLELSLMWKNEEVENQKKTEEEKNKKMRNIKIRAQQIRMLLESGLKALIEERENREQVRKATEEQLQLQSQVQRQSSQEPVVQRNNKRGRSQDDVESGEEEEVSKRPKRWNIEDA